MPAATMNGKKQSRKPAAKREPLSLSLIEVPYAEPHDGHCSQQVETRLTPRQAAALKAVLCRLRDDGEFCDMGGVSDPRGKRVEESPHVIRYMLDKVADSIEAETGSELVKDFGLKF